jgi:hypothetical protein
VTNFGPKMRSCRFEIYRMYYLKKNKKNHMLRSKNQIRSRSTPSYNRLDQPPRDNQTEVLLVLRPLSRQLRKGCEGARAERVFILRVEYYYPSNRFLLFVKHLAMSIPTRKFLIRHNTPTGNNILGLRNVCVLE